MFTLTEAIRQVEAALARGERLSEVIGAVSRDYALDRSLLARRWVQFTPSGPAAVISSLKTATGPTRAAGGR
jgi:hypothetical protein